MADTSLELDGLAEYIQEKQALFDSLLDDLGCTEEEIKNGGMSRCAVCPDHFVPDNLLQNHEQVCQYTSKYGLMDCQESKEFMSLVDGHFAASENSRVSLDRNILKAISSYCRQHNSSLSHDSHVTQTTSLEDTKHPPQEALQSLDPIGLIRYVKSWQLVPPSYCPLSPSVLHPVSLKSWIFNNLPQEHLYSNQVGGEMRLADSVLSCIFATPTLTPNVLAERLRPLLNNQCGKFVLSFWKFVVILGIQEEHKIQNNVVDELLPLSIKDRSEALPTSLVAEIQTIADSLEGTNTKPDSFPSVPVPAHHITSHMTTEERRVLYDYTIELSQQKMGLSKEYLNDPNLFRDDIATVTSKQGDDDGTDSKSYLEVLKEMRDYRRRRQSYRAKNVHVTKKTTKQIFHDIIEARTKEIQLSLGIGTDSTTTNTDTQVERRGRPDINDNSRDNVGDAKRTTECRSRSPRQYHTHSRRSSHSKRSETSATGDNTPSVNERASQRRKSGSRSPSWRSKCERSRSPSRKQKTKSPHSSHSKHKSGSHARSHSRDRKHHKKHKHSSKHDCMTSLTSLNN